MQEGRLKKLVLILSLVFLAGICLYPFIALNFKIITPQPSGEFSLKYYAKIFQHKSTLLAIKNTVIVSIGCGLVSLLFALPLSWLLTRTDLPMRHVFRSLFCLPYAIPPYIGAMAWIYLANPQSGLINLLWGSSILDIYTYPGLIWVMSTFLYTFVLLSLLSALDRMDPSLEEAARLSGAGPIRVFFNITLPIIMPSLLSGVLLVLLATAASFGVPALIGTPAGIYMLTTRIYTFQKMGSLSGVYSAGALAVVLLVLAIFVLYLNQKILKGHFKTVSGKVVRPSLIELHQYRWPLFIGMLILFFFLFILPVFGIVVTALNKIQGQFAWSNLGFQNFTKVFFEVDETPRALWNSLKLATAAATIATFWGFLLAYFNQKSNKGTNKFIEVLASLPFATPGTVLALAFILAFGQNIFGLSISLYNTLTLIVLAYIAKYFNFSFRTAKDGITQVDPCLEEAARVSGASWWKTMQSIWLPLMKPVLVSSWFLVFMPCFSELTMTILLSGPGLETLGTLIFQLQEYADASGGGAAVLALCTITTVAGINYFVKFISKGKYGL